MKPRQTTEDFINRCRKIHGNKYNYDETIYIKDSETVTIICPIHGEITIIANSHKHGKGCKECGKIQSINSRIKGRINFEKKAREIHGSKYDYSLIPTKFKVRDIVTIICNFHGRFNQVAYYHLNGNGCSICKYSKGEESILNYLRDNNIKYETQKKFKEYSNLESFDFYIEEYNLIIEYDGEQHFRPTRFSYSVSEEESILNYESQILRDSSKKKWCLEKNIFLLRIPYYNYTKIKEILDEAFRIKR